MVLTQIIYFPTWNEKNDYFYFDNSLQFDFYNNLLPIRGTDVAQPREELKNNKKKLFKFFFEISTVHLWLENVFQKMVDCTVLLDFWLSWIFTKL